jgi:hypothetical protein
MDVKCLKCGAFNIPDNHVCGRCGASLPIVYDHEGNVFNWRADSHPREFLNQATRSRNRLSPSSLAWFLRILLILSAFVAAYFIMRRR